jgi:membrane protease YdiL (CAAX protease family)
MGAWRTYWSNASLRDARANEWSIARLVARAPPWAAASLVTAIAFGLLSLPLVPSHWRWQSTGIRLFEQPFAKAFLAAVVIAPLVETLLCQVIPLEILRRVTSRGWVAVLASALFFGSLHTIRGGPHQAVAAFGSGLVFGLLYVRARKLGVTRGYVAVVAVHAIHNAVVLLLVAALLRLANRSWMT